MLGSLLKVTLYFFFMFGIDASGIFIACEAGNYSSVYRLLSQGVDPNICDSKQISSFFFKINLLI
jgi:hypothetical protein